MSAGRQCKMCIRDSSFGRASVISGHTLKAEGLTAAQVGKVHSGPPVWAAVGKQHAQAGQNGGRSPASFSQDVYKRQEACLHVQMPEPHILADIDTPEQYEALLRLEQPR